MSLEAMRSVPARIEAGIVFKPVGLPSTQPQTDGLTIKSLRTSSAFGGRTVGVVDACTGSGDANPESSVGSGHGAPLPRGGTEKHDTESAAPRFSRTKMRSDKLLHYAARPRADWLASDANIWYLAKIESVVKQAWGVRI
jgi:hypothetical protein